MFEMLRRLAKNLPTLILAFALAVAVWISAETASDPNEERVFPTPITITYQGQDPSLLMIGEPAHQLTLTLKAPRSIWDRLIADENLVKAVVDLAGLGAGTHTIPVQVSIGLRPVEISSRIPETVKVKLEPLANKTIKVRLDVKGDVAVGFKAGVATLESDTVMVSGAESLVTQVAAVRTTLDLTNVKEDVHQPLQLVPVDVNEDQVSGVTLTPSQVTVSVPVTQRGGYRNLVVKVLVNGQIAPGFRLANIFVYPPVVTVFSANPAVVENLPGYVETTPINLNGARDGLDLQVQLNLPEGVQLVGDQTVNVQVAITAIEGSLTLTGLRVDMVGLGPDLQASVSPDRVDVIVSGPLYLLDQLVGNQAHVYVDLTEKADGTYQLTPKVDLAIADLRVESVLPSTIEVVIIKVTPTPTPTVNRTLTVTVTPTRTATPTLTPRPPALPTPTPTPTP
jgi:YbbR domain-containing protein